jgi:hypothetical protein
MALPDLQKSNLLVFLQAGRLCRFIDRPDGIQ